MKREQKTVTVTIGDKDHSRDYEKISYENREDILSAISTDDGLTGVLANLNYGYDLKQRATVRQAILDAHQGPEKSQEKMAKELVKVFAGMGQNLTLEQALERVKALSPAIVNDSQPDSPLNPRTETQPA